MISLHSISPPQLFCMPFSSKHPQTKSTMWKLQQPTSESLKHHHLHLPQTYSSSRWCPTQEQLRALEEFYKRGIRTPSTYQIQQITAQLRRFGKIEGKNVFYWFQNHKARERQRIRRRLSLGSKDVQGVKNKSWPSNARLEGSVSVPIGRADTTGGEKDGCIKQISSLQDNNNNGISPSSTTINEDSYACIDWQFESPEITRRPSKTLELFPVRRDEKAKDDGRVEFYEFL